MTIGEKIQQLRKEKEITQKELAEKLGLAEITIRQYETNKREPKIATLSKIAKILGTGLETFLTDDEQSLFEDMANLYLKSDSNINFLKSSQEHTPQENYLLAKLRELNEKGKKKATDYIDDLTQITEYKKE
jgi:transcriptional regulator with XRE-family HTH domain